MYFFLKIYILKSKFFKLSEDFLFKKLVGLYLYLDKFQSAFIPIA